MSSGTVLEWLKAPESSVEAGEPLLAVLTEKAAVDVEAPVAGILLRIDVPEGKEVPVGTVLGWIGAPDEAAEELPSAGAQVERPREEMGPATRSHQGVSQLDGQSRESQQPGNRRRPQASPVARRLASEHGVSLSAIEGTGPRGIITRSDVEQAAGEAAAQPRQGAEPGQEHVERIPLEGIRRVMAERMARSKRTAADVTTVVDVDMGAVKSLKKHVPLTYTSAVVKAVGMALRQHPMLNASLDLDEIVLHKGVHIGVAVDDAAVTASTRGLMVLTIADADGKSLREIDGELRRLAQEVRQGRPRMEGVEPPTFTVTNSGVLGALMFTPIINPPQSAIMGMGKVREVPVVKDGKIVVGTVMYLCLTYDHRIVEGGEAVGFLQEVKRCLEDPVRMV
jgi:pyruvate/2-oxoglutarate dehydrogenase complex dihydrolipoamide acyltransferase (E2) component